MGYQSVTVVIYSFRVISTVFLRFDPMLCKIQRRKRQHRLEGDSTGEGKCKFGRSSSETEEVMGSPVKMEVKGVPVVTGAAELSLPRGKRKSMRSSDNEALNDSLTRVWMALRKKKK